MYKVNKILKLIKAAFDYFTPVLTVAVPFIIYFSIKNYGYRYLFSGLIILYLLKLTSSLRRGVNKKQLFMFIIIGGFLCCAIILNRFSIALYTPFLINLGLLVSFGSTLFIGPPVIEVFARRHVKILSDSEIKYCRKLTAIWSLFFLFNGSISMIISLSKNMEYWIIYNGFISYVLIGMFFLIEMTYRYYRFRNYGNTIIDSFFKRIFKPYSVGN